MKTRPVATYRIQLNKEFTFQDTLKITDYLRDLNISHIYLSPLLSSVPDSNHGYDSTDFLTVSEERGGEKGFQELVKKICAYDYPMKMIIDIVPNHMAAHFYNKYWQDVLKQGSQSPYRSLFDLRISEGNKIKLPVLASDLKEAISEFKLVTVDKEKFLEYKGVNYPLNDASLKNIPAQPDIASLLSAQHYELTSWKDLSESISYRRFFDVIGLIGVKVENENIFNMTHQKILEMLEQHPCIDGVRIDHIDGLADPKNYLDRLYKKVSDVWIEKILAREEDIEEGWKTQGTTGYEFIDRINQLFVHPENFTEIQNFWLKTSDSQWATFEDCVLDSKRQILNELFTPELERLVKLSCTDGQDEEKARVFWTGLTLGLPVYRIYNEDDLSQNRWIREASATAKRLSKSYAETEKIFLPQVIAPETDSQKKAFQEWQQLSGPVMAKGLEDTAHYRFTPLAALNEVGCSPVLAKTSPDDFFAWQNRRAKTTPNAMNATSTHDTKRSEDTRHRLYALADRPDKWMEFFASASKITAQYKKNVLSARVEYFIYQTLLGTWPLNEIPDGTYEDRIHAYLQKALREARQDTAWTKVNAEFEDAVNNFVSGVLKDADFKTLITDFTRVLSPLGALNSLSVTVLKILSLGLPDIYQGMDSWEFNLVDPDNRRPVDYARRQKLLFMADDLEQKSGRTALTQYLSQNWKDGAIKTWLTRECLRIRQTHLTDISEPQIESLPVTGTYKTSLIAYRIGDKNSGLIVLCPRYPGMTDSQELTINWKDTAVVLPEGAYQFSDLIHGRTVTRKEYNLAGDLLSSFPVSVISYK